MGTAIATNAPCCRIGPVSRARAPTRAVRASAGRSAYDDASPNSRRHFMAGLAGALTFGSLADEASAELPGFKKDLSKRRRVTIPREAYKFNEDGLGIYDVAEGTGDTAFVGDRVVVHFDCKWRNLTVYTSRQGMGVTGGTPLGFDVGQAGGPGGTLLGLDLGVRGMRVGGRRSLIVPPSLGWGSRQVGEVPPDQELTIEVELLSIKADPITGRRGRKVDAEA